MVTDNKLVPVSNGEATNNIVALPTRPEPTTASEKAIAFVKEHPVLTIAGGVALGLVVSALIPRSVGRRLTKRAYRYAEAGAAAALSLGQNTLDKAEDGGVVARKKAKLLTAQAEKFGSRAAARAEKIGSRAAARAEKIGAKAAARAEKLSDKAAARAERLGVAALGTASVWGHAAADKAEVLGHAAAARVEHLGERASDRLSHLGDKALNQSSKLFGHPKAAKSVADRLADKAHNVRERIRG